MFILNTSGVSISHVPILLFFFFFNPSPPRYIPIDIIIASFKKQSFHPSFSASPSTFKTSWSCKDAAVKLTTCVHPSTVSFSIYPSLSLLFFLSFFLFPCCWVYPSFGTIPFSHSPGSQLPGPQRVDQQAGVIETSPRGQQCYSYVLVLGFFQNTITLYLSETNTVHIATAVLKSSATAQASTTTINTDILLLTIDYIHSSIVFFNHNYHSSCCFSYNSS